MRKKWKKIFGHQVVPHMVPDDLMNVVLDVVRPQAKEQITHELVANPIFGHLIPKTKKKKKKRKKKKRKKKSDIERTEQRGPSFFLRLQAQEQKQYVKLPYMNVNKRENVN